MDLGHWLTIIGLLLATVGAFFTWVVMRHVNAVDTLQREFALFKQDVLPLYVKEEDVEMQFGELKKHLEFLRSDGIRREEVILTAIREQARSASQENQTLRTDVRSVHERVDRLFAPRGGNT